jgi:hypothetical protein
MASTFIVTIPKAEYNPLLYQGIQVASSYPQLQAIITNNLSAAHAAIFAQPFSTQVGDDIDWYSQTSGPAANLTTLPPERQQQIKAHLQQMGAEIAELARTMQNSPDPSRATSGHILELALRYPAFENVYLVGDQPVITCWGFVPARSGASPQDLMRTGEAMPSPPAPPSAPAPAPTPSSAPAPLAAAGAKPPPSRPLQFISSQFIWPAWLKKLLVILLGILSATLILYLLGHIPGCSFNLPFLRGGAGAEITPPSNSIARPAAPSPVSPTAPSPAAPSAAPAAMEALVRQEAELREKLRSLNNQLILYANQCQVKPPGASAPPADAPAPPTTQPENLPLRNTAPQPSAQPPQMESLLPRTQAPSVPEVIEVTPEVIKVKPEIEIAPSDRPLNIPPEASSRNDFGFLHGCWVNSSSLYNQSNSAPLLTQYCFDENGKGSRTIQQPDGGLCTGSLQASFDNSGNLLLQAGAANCAAGGQYIPQRIECRGSGESTNCQGREQGQDKQWQATFRRR